MDDYAKFIHSSRYARWREEEGKRETWPQTVARYVDFFWNKYGRLDPTRKTFDSIYNSILSLDVMPSMRALMTAGPALEADQVAGYNCCFVAIDDPIVFDEIMYILMCFHPDTKVVTRAGNKRIADIQIGDEVASIDESTGKCVWKTVTDNIKTKSSNKPKVEVLLDNGQKFKCTSDHKWLTTNRGWVEAGDLTTEDDLVSPTWKIYRITNSLNNKSYIGQTSKSVKSRLAKHMYDSKNNIGNSHFRKAIRKYPSSVWSIDIIDFAFSQAEANEKEVYWISKCDTLSNGYNSTVGGEGSSGYMWTDEQRRRASENTYERTDEHRERQRRVLAMSKEKIDLARSTEEYKEAQRIRNLGERNPHYGKKHSEEWKAKLRERNTGASNPFFGRKHSEETKYKISATKKAMKHKLEEVG